MDFKQLRNTLGLGGGPPTTAPYNHHHQHSSSQKPSQAHAYQQNIKHQWSIRTPVQETSKAQSLQR
jgi:hypothetical protein